MNVLELARREVGFGLDIMRDTATVRLSSFGL
jgi:hypothetical protein